VIERFPQDTPPCPSCLTGVGAAVGVMAARNATTVIFRCCFCQHEWTDRHLESKDPSEKSDAA